MKKLLFIIVSCLVFITSAFSQDFNVLDYYPILNKGTTWVYENSKGNVCDTYIVGDVFKEDGNIVVAIYDEMGFGHVVSVVAVEGNKILTIGNTDIFGNSHYCNRPYPLVLGPIGIEYTYREMGSDKGDVIVCTTEKTSISVNGKTYDDCILVKCKNMTASVINKYYYARNIGLVYRTIVGKNGEESVYFKLKEKK